MPTILMTGGHSGLGLVGARSIAGQFGCGLTDYPLSGAEAAEAFIGCLAGFARVLH
jgi:hypothetical protein